MNGIQDKINKLQDSLKDKKQKDLRFDIKNGDLCFKDWIVFKLLTEEISKPLQRKNDIGHYNRAINAAKSIKCEYS